MKRTATVFVIALLVSAVFGSDDTSPVNDGHVLPSLGPPPQSRDDVPPFGTILQQWALEMSGSYAGSGITWRRDEGRFYLMDQCYAPGERVWKLDPADPLGTLEAVPWHADTFLGVSTMIPWGLVWDPDNGCFWISGLVDGPTISGCYLFRYVWNGDWWTWGGAPGDSWKVGDNNNGGALQCYWIAGIEKSPVDGLFYAAPVASSPSVLNYVVRFDPYTKTNHGRVAYGDQVSERGCALIPWDSSYILTCGWNADAYRKRDSTGYLLAQASAGRGPADWSLHFPQGVRSDDTVCVFCMTSHSQNYLQRISVGMLWGQLPSAFQPSVRPLHILSPLGVVDSGETVMPRLVVHNSADTAAEDVAVHFLIDTEADVVIYHDSMTVSLPPLATDTLEFSAWTATGRDSMGAIAWTHWQGDSVPEDDTLLQRFLVRVRRIRIIPIWPRPGDTIDPGPTTIEAQLWNEGNVPLTFPLVFNLGPYWDSTWVINFLAGGSRTVSWPWVAIPGVWVCTIRTPYGDTSWMFYVRGGPVDHDVEVVSIDAPVGVIDTTPFHPRATIRNNGTGAESFWVHFWLEDTASDAVVYWDSVNATLPGGLQTQQVFTQTRLTVEGPYAASCSAHLSTDQDWSNNARHVNFRVEAGVGVKDVLPGTGSSTRPRTVLRGGALADLGLPPDVEVLVFDPMGREVARLRPGVDDTRILAPGIYYFRVRTDDALTCRKVVKLK